MKKLTKLILKLKIFLGMLFLLLKGNDVKGQEVYDPGSCYRGVPPRPKIYIHGDVSIAKNWNFNAKNGLFIFQLGHSRGLRTHGIRFDYQKNESSYGPYLRLFPFDKKKKGWVDYSWSFTPFVETSVLFPIQNRFSHNDVSVTYGLIYSDKCSAGIELFQSIRSDMTKPEGFNMYTGIRIHYYFVERAILVLKRRR